jgi:hypothetical protein
MQLAVTKDEMLASSIEALRKRWNLQDAAGWVREALLVWLTGKTATESDFMKAFTAWRAARDKALAEGQDVKYPEFQSELWHLEMWLLGMLERVIKGRSGVTEEEFSELLGWLEENYRRLEPVNEVRSVQLGAVQTSVWNVLIQMRKGPRQSQAGELAEAVRQLKLNAG